MKRLIAAAVLAFAVSACGTESPAPATPSPVVAPTSAATSAAVAVANPCDPAKDNGCGTPDAECATNRLGKQFVVDGVVYTCSEPKPYHWRRAS